MGMVSAEGVWREGAYMLALLPPEVVEELELEALMPAILEVSD